LIIASSSATGWREYDKNVSVSRKSAWIDLVKGKSYYTEAKHVSSTTVSEHMTVSVEI
jgi:hypothetical protein